MSKPIELISLESTLWDVISGFSHREVSAEVSRQAEHELPPASWALLEYLNSVGPMRVSDIAACLGIDVSSVTPRLQTLERVGLVDRGTDAEDRRASVLSIGPAGREALERIHAARIAILAEALVGLDAEHVAIASEVLQRISTRLRRDLAYKQP